MARTDREIEAQLTADPMPIPEWSESPDDPDWACLDLDGEIVYGCTRAICLVHRAERNFHIAKARAAGEVVIPFEFVREILQQYLDKYPTLAVAEEAYGDAA